MRSAPESGPASAARLDRALTLLVALATLLYVVHRSLAPMDETDLFFHLKIGQLILARHAIPFQNLFSFTYPAHHDPDLAWGFQVTVALLYRWGGFAAVSLFKTACVTAAAMLVHRACRRAGAGPLTASAATVLAVIAAGQRIVERPHLVTFVGLGALQLLLVEVERGRRRLLWAIVPLTIVWANFHAGVFLAPVVLGLYALGAELDRAPLAPRRTVLSLLALTTLATCATPAGFGLVRYLLWHTGLGATRIIEEFRHADLYDDPWFFILLTACTIGLVRRGRAVGLRRLLPPLLLAPLALRSVRFVAEWSLLAAPLLAAGFADLGLAPRTRRAALAIASASLLGLIAFARLGAPLAIGLAPDVVPFDAIAFATQDGLRDRMYSDLDVGCYLLWEGWPRYSVFQDARLPAYPDEFHRALDRTPLDPASFDALLGRYGVTSALLAEPDVNMRAGSFDPARWALVFRSPDALLFARRLPRFSAVIAAHEIPLRPRFAFLGGTHFEALREEPAGSPVPACEWDARLARALEEDGDPHGALDARAESLGRGCLAPTEAAEVLYRLGARLQLAGDSDAAAKEYDRALALAPNHVSALINRGFARLKSDPEQARADFTRALALAPDRKDARLGLARLHAR